MLGWLVRDGTAVRDGSTDFVTEPEKDVELVNEGDDVTDKEMEEVTEMLGLDVEEIEILSVFE